MRLTRRWLLGLFGAAAVAPVLPRVSPEPAVRLLAGQFDKMGGWAPTDQSIGNIPTLWWHYPGLYSDELSRILKEQSQSWTELKEKVL